MAKTTETILALDPGLRDLGYAILRGPDLLDHGVLALRGIPPEQKLGVVSQSLKRLIRGYAPSVLVLEHIPKRPLDAIAGLPALGRFLASLARRLHLGFASYSARSVRQAVVGNGWAGKRETAEHLAGRFPELRAYLGQDRKWKVAYFHNMFDALALAVYHQLLTQPPSRSRRSG